MPRCWLLSSSTFTGSFSQKQVASSWMFIWKLPSPSISITRRSGNWLCTPIADGQAEAHRAEAAAGEERARLGELEELGGPHLVLTDAHRDHRVAVVRELPELADRVLLQDAGERLVVVERFGLLPLAGIARPRRTMSSGRSTILLSSASAYFTSLQTGMWAGLFLLSSEASMSTWTILPCLAELFHLAGHAVVEPHAERDAAGRPCSTA